MAQGKKSESKAASPKTANNPAAETAGTTTPTKPPAIPSTKPSTKPPTRKGAAFKPSLADIQLRAYYLGEDRRKAGRASDPDADWLEAERQLLAESGEKTARPAPAKKPAVKKPAAPA